MTLDLWGHVRSSCWQGQNNLWQKYNDHDHRRMVDFRLYSEKVYNFQITMWKSNHLWWRHFQSIMMSSEVKLVCDSRFWVELSFAIKIFEFRPSRISLDFVEWGLLFNFQSQKNQPKFAPIHNPKGVFS